jgi:hypothetical protein
MLAEIVKEAKRKYCNKQIMNLDNKIKTIWNVLKRETGQV